MGTNERGQSTLWMLAVIAVAMTLVLGLTRTVGEARSRSGAQNVADLVALAGVTGGREAAAALARRDGAEMTAWATEGDRVTVTVRRGTADATATAEPVADEGER